MRNRNGKDPRRILDKIWLVAVTVQLIQTIRRIATDDYDD